MTLGFPVRYWELAGEVEYRKLLWSLAIGLGLLLNVAISLATLALRQGPAYAVRTDTAGHADLIELPRNGSTTIALAAAGHQPATRRDEAERFVEEMGSRLFSWDDDRKSANREFVGARMEPQVLDRLPDVVPAYRASLQGDVSGRVDSEVRITRVIGELPPFQIEVQTDIEFSGQYLPPGLGERDPENSRRESYAFLFTVAETVRTPVNPAGLLVVDLVRAARLSR